MILWILFTGIQKDGGTESNVRNDVQNHFGKKISKGITSESQCIKVRHEHDLFLDIKSEKDLNVIL